jgi:hypothetical protein
MRIAELFLESSTIGSVGSTTGPTSTVGTVSNVPSDKPGTLAQSKNTNPNLQKLAATLKQNNIVDNEADINDFISAYQAQSTGKTLNPQQQSSMASLATAMLKNKSLAGNLDLQLKAMSQQKPGQPMGQNPSQGLM